MLVAFTYFVSRLWPRWEPSAGLELMSLRSGPELRSGVHASATERGLS